MGFVGRGITSLLYPERSSIVECLALEPELMVVLVLALECGPYDVAVHLTPSV